MPLEQNQGGQSVNVVTPEGKSYSIDLSKVAPYNNPTCEHVFEDDPTDQTEHMMAQVCVRPGCNMGRMIRKSS